MTIIHTVLSPSEVKRLSLVDRDYLERKLQDNCLLNNILRRPVNRPLLSELRCVLDRQPLPRRKIEQQRRNSDVRVYKNGKLIRIEHSNGKVMKYV